MARDVVRMMVALIITVIIVSATIGGTIALTNMLSPAPVDLPTAPSVLSLTPGQIAVVSTYTSVISATQAPRPTSTAAVPPTSTRTPTPTLTPTFTPAPADPCADPAAYRAAVVTEQPRLSPLPGTFVSDGEQILVATWTVENRGTCPWRAMRFVIDKVSQMPAPSAPPQLREPSDNVEMLIGPRRQVQVVLLVAAREVAGRTLDWRWTMQVAGPGGNWVSLPEKLRLQMSQAWVNLEMSPVVQVTAIQPAGLAASPVAPAETIKPTALAVRPSPTKTPFPTAIPTATARTRLLPAPTVLPQPVGTALMVTRVATPVVPVATSTPIARPVPSPTAMALPPPAPPRLMQPRPPDNFQDFAGEETYVGYDATVEFRWEQDGRPLQPDEYYVIAITHKRGIEYRWAGQMAYYRPPPTQEGFMGWLVDFADPVGRLWWKVLVVKTGRANPGGPPGPDDVVLAESALGTFRWIKPGGPSREKGGEGPRGGID